ncbi:MAG: hypothetical protein ACJ79S_07080 [Gemmatimonadaceae bacterium]
MPERAPAPSRLARAAVAFAIGALAGLGCYLHLRHAGMLAGDFTWPWRAARALLEGQNPYAAIRPSGPFPFDAYFKYPLPAALVALPVAALEPHAAGALFFGVSVTLLAWALTRDGYSRLLVLASGPLLSAATMVQWSPLLAAAALLPALGFVAAAKPNLGLAAVGARPTWRAVGGAAALLLVSLAVLPRWPLDWLSVLRQGTEAHYRAPVTLPGGALVLVLLLRWRRPEARLVLFLACVPQIIAFYDQLLLLLVPRTRRESMLAALLSLVAFQGWLARGGLAPAEWTGTTQAWPWIATLLFAPAVVMILRRPNEGPTPLWAHRCAAWLDARRMRRRGAQGRAEAE